MSTRSALTFLLAAASLAAGGTTPDDNYAWVQTQAGTLRQENSFCVRDTAAQGLGGGEWLSSRWGWEATLLTDQLEDTARLWKAREVHVHATALHSPFGQLGAWRPFLRAGVGFSDLQAPASLSATSTRRLNLAGGLGTQLVLGAWGLASLEARYVNVRSDTPRSEYQFLAGLGVRWGHGTPSPKPESTPAPVPTSATALLPAPAAILPPPAATVQPEPMKAAVVPIPVPPEPNIEPPPRTIVLGEAVLHFANNGAELGPEAAVAIREVAAQLKAYPGSYTLLISGHTSNLGSRTHNLALAKRRAEAVAQLLAEAGIPADRLSTEGRGPDAPIADNATRDGQSRNRRVEIEVKAADPSIQINRTDTALVEIPTTTRPKPGVKPRQ